MKLQSNLAIVLAAFFGLTACNMTTGLERNVQNPMSFLTYAAVGQDVKTIVIGNPTKASDATLAKVVTDALQRNYAYLNTNFTTQSSDRVVEPYKIVFAFNPPAHLMGHAICSDPSSVDTVQRSDKTFIMALFCENDALTEIAAYIGPSPDIDSEQFRNTIDFLAWKLVPIHEIPLDGGCDPNVVC